MTTNKIYRAIETPIVFQDADGDVVITLQNLAAGAGRLSARKDRGAGSQPRLWKWKAVIQFETAAVVGEQVEILLSESDGTDADGGVGSSDAALTAGQKLNMATIGIVRAQTTDTATSFIASGTCLINERYFSVGVWNGSAADNLENTSKACRITFTPIPDDIQAAA